MSKETAFELRDVDDLIPFLKPEYRSASMTTNQCLAIIEAIAAVGRMIYFVGTKSPLLSPQKVLDNYNKAFEIIRNRLKTENERICDDSKRN